MTLLDAKLPSPPRKIWKAVGIGLAIVVIAGVLFYAFRNYPEERAVVRFLANLQQGNYREAYRLWQPAPSYTYENFLHDWGEQGDYGKIREFKIIGTRSKGPDTVIVTVKINNVDPPLELLVDRETKGLAFSPF
jgi:hypothetical protein